MPPRKPVVHPFDVAHGTETSGLLSGKVIARGTTAKPEDLTAYYGIAPSILRSVLDLWLQKLHPLAPIERTVFLDVGAGKGRAMLVASEYPFLRIEGVELNPTLAEVTRRNISIWENAQPLTMLSPLLLREADATRVALPREPVLAHLFHPFEDRLLRRFLRHVERDLANHPRPFDLLYVNAEHDSLLDKYPALERLWLGRIPMSAEDHIADLAAIAQQKEYGSTGDELCAIYRFKSKQTKAQNNETKAPRRSYR